MALDIRIAGRYRLGRKIGGGSFGDVYLGTNIQTGEEVSIKLVRIAGRLAVMRTMIRHTGTPRSIDFRCPLPRAALTGSASLSIAGIHQEPAPAAVLRIEAVQDPSRRRCVARYCRSFMLCLLFGHYVFACIPPRLAFVFTTYFYASSQLASPMCAGMALRGTTTSW